MMQFVSRVFWPAYLAACLAEMACFSLIAPTDLSLRGGVGDLSDIAIYSIGFIAFLGVGIFSSLLTCYLSKTAGEVNRRAADNHGIVVAAPR